MRKQFIKFNIATNNVGVNDDINTIVGALEEVCAQIEINDKVEEFIKQVTANDDIIPALTACAEKLFERNNWGRVIVSKKKNK